MEAPHGVEVTKRQSGRQKWMYLLNHTAQPQTVKFEGSWKEVLSGSVHAGSVSLGEYGASVLQTEETS